MGRKVVLLVLATVLALSGCNYKTVGAPKGHLTLTAEFNDVQGLVAGHSVKMSDITIGSVTKVQLDGYRAKATLSIKDGIRIPQGTRAEIKVTSLLGENYVRLNLPAGHRLDTGPFLAIGATIGNTSVQPDLEQISDRIGPLLAALGGQDVATISAESATAVGGKGEQLNTLIARAGKVGDQYAGASVRHGE